MKQTTSLKHLLAAGCFILLSACSDSSTTKTSTDSTDKKDTSPSTEMTTGDSGKMTSTETKMDDGVYLAEAATSDMVEIKASEDAKSKTNNKDVKELAKMMIEEHTKMSKGTKDLATTKNVALPSEMPADKKAMLDKAAALKGSEFDKEYISQLKAGHEAAISMLERASSSAEDADIKAWATDALPKVKHHLEMIKETEGKIK